MFFRTARPTNDLEALRRFYVDGIGLIVRSKFINHDGFDGLILVPSDKNWEIEFIKEDKPAPKAPTNEHIFVFYYQKTEFKACIDRLIALGAKKTDANNPYWQRNGITFEDPDGYHVVLALDD